MNILLTGASGFIGSYVFDSLNELYNVFSIVSSKGKAIGKNNIVANLEKNDALNKVIEGIPAGVSIDIVIHLASKLSSDNLYNNANTLSSNIIISENLAKIVIALSPRKLINFSSTSIYPNTTGLFSEDSLPAPQKNSDCMYGLSKLAAEITFDYLLKESKVEITHLRIGQVYGDGMRKDRLVPTMLDELKKSNSITVFGNGERSSNFIHIHELTKIILIFLTKKCPGIYNVGTEKQDLL